MELNSPKKLVGKKIKVSGRSDIIKVMAFGDRYFMVRYVGCMPFAISETEMQSAINSGQYKVIEP